jgi:putative transposase
MGYKIPSSHKKLGGQLGYFVYFLAYPPGIRKIIYTTNIIEGLHRQFRKVTKTKAVFPNDDSLRKMLYLASNNITKKWTQRYRDWEMVLNHLAILFENRHAI